jgi:hypothetical protein
MLTVDEIEDSFDTAFLHSAEDLPDEQLRLMLTNLRALREVAPPSLAASRARDIIAAVLARRHPDEAIPEPQPEPEPEVLEPQVEQVAVETVEVAFETMSISLGVEAEAPQPEPAALETAEETPQPKPQDDGALGWNHPSIPMEQPLRRLQRVMHWFFG